VDDRAPGRASIADALGIPGARAVSVLDPEGPTLLWWAGDGPPGERTVAAAVNLAMAATGLVGDLGDVLVTSNTSFHVIRLVTTEPPFVAHLDLRRDSANLAMARHEFKALLEADRGAITELPQPPLPQRHRGAELSAEAASPEDWLSLVRQPYRTDEGVLDQILVALRRL
jgi:hypothetical protein